MKVPLTAFSSKEKLIISHNGKDEEVKFPFRPFALAQKDQFPELDVQTEVWTKVPENEPREYLKCSFETLETANDFKRRYSERQRYFQMIGYMDQLFIYDEDFMLQYPHTEDLKVMFFDIEVASKGDGYFPKPATNEILCIGYSIWVYKNDGSKEKIKQNIVKGFDQYTGLSPEGISWKDLEVLKGFVDAVREEDPDIIAGYNSEEFDFPYLIDRCKLVQVDMKGIGRNNKAPYIVDGKVRIPGRIHFDLYNSNAGVSKDQTLFGIKSRTLKEIARFYKVDIDDVEVSEHIENLLALFESDAPLLYSYQDADVLRTEHVGHVYLRNCITLAELMKVPLGAIIGMYSSFVPKLYIARSMKTQRLINTETNFQRYNSNNGTIAALGTKYEGALVGLYKDGLFPSVYKLDFASMYPSSIQTWNLGPDTTSFVRKLPYTGRYSFSQDSKYNWYRIPDANFKCDVLVKVRNDQEGLLKSEIKKLREERVRIKGELKRCSEVEKPALDSQQYAIKVILNCFHPNTDIFTRDGIKKLKDVKVGDLVWSINPYTFEPELKEVEKTYEYDIADQDLYNITHNRFSQSVTEGHKMLGINRNKSFFEEAQYFTKRNRVKVPSHNSTAIADSMINLLDYVDASNYELIVLHKEDLRVLKSEFPQVEFRKAPTIKGGSYILTEWNDNVRDLCRRHYKILARHKRSKLCAAVPVKVLNSVFSNFVGWYLSEGSLYTSNLKEYSNTTRGISKKITISQDNINQDYKEEIESSLNNLLFEGLKCSVYKNDKGFSFSSDLYSELIETHLGTKFNKHISNDLMEKLNLSDILDAMYKGDGTKGQRLYTISQKNTSLFNSYIELLIRCGRMFTYRIDSGCYRITDNPDNITLRKDNTTITKYSGKVYSLTVKDNHTVYAGLNGKMGWIGQSIYGLLGLKSSTYGDMISAMMVTAMCRWTTGMVIRKYKEELVELDTDGLILDAPVNEEETNEWLDQLMLEKFKIDDNYMEMELESFGRAYFYAMKNYIVQEGEKYIIHGSSLKGSRSAKIVDRAIKLAIEHVFNGKPKEEVIQEAYAFNDLDLEMFEERVKLSKEPREYEDQFDMRLFLAAQMKMKTGQVVGRGTQINYVVAKNQLPFEELQPYYRRNGKNYTFLGYVDSLDDLNLPYYRELVDKALEKFGISEVQQLNLFGEDFAPKSKKKLDVVPTEPLELETKKSVKMQG